MTAYNLPTSFTTSCLPLVAIEYKSLFRFLSESITLKVVLCSRTTDFFKNAFFVQWFISLTGWCRPGLEVQKCKCPKRRKYRSSWKYKFAAGGDILPSAFLQGLLTRYSIGVLTCSTTLTSRTVLSCATRFEKKRNTPKRGGANSQGADAKIERNIASTILFPHRIEGKIKFGQWNYFLYWTMTSTRNNPLSEKCVFWRAVFWGRNTTSEMMFWRENERKCYMHFQLVGDSW